MRVVIPAEGVVVLGLVLIAFVTVVTLAGGHDPAPTFPPPRGMEGCALTFEINRRAGSLSAISEVVRGPGENVRVYDCDGHVTIVRRDY